MAKPLVIIAGPTAVGKSEIAVKLAHRINGSIISADSMQVYRGMNIGTAKISTDEMENIPHYLIDILDPSEDFNIVAFKERAEEAISDITASGRIPIMVGGTGFYIQSVVYDTVFPETGELTGYRGDLTRLIEEKGGEYVHAILEKTDPKAASYIHFNDHKRMIRALEYHRQTGRLISDHNEESLSRTSPYDLCYFVLNDKREIIYQKINERVDRMIEAGLVDEVKGLVERGLTKDNISMHGLGYKEIIEYLYGDCTLEVAVDRIKKGSRHFAKRQLTWFKRERDVIWIDKSENVDVLQSMTDILKQKGIYDG